MRGGNGKFQRRDFRLDRMTQSAGLREEGMLFQHLGKHEVFQPVKTWPPRKRSSPSSATCTDVPGRGRPTLPILIASGRFTVNAPVVSVRP